MRRRNVPDASRLVLIGLAALLLHPAPAASQGRQTDLLSDVPLKVDVVISRYKGETRTSSLPFTLMVRARDERRGRDTGSVRMGVDVPIGTTETTSNRGQTNTTSTTTSQPRYRYVGTAIVCVAFVGDGGFTVTVSVEDSAIHTDPSAPPAAFNPDLTAFRTFSMSNTQFVRPGGTVQYAVASDKVTGEVVKVDVTVTLVK